MNTIIPKNKVDIFFLGFYLFAIGSALVSISFIPIPVSRFIQLIGVFFIIILFSVNYRYKELSLYARFVFLLFVVYQIIIIIRDNQFSLWGIQRYLFTPGYLLYLAPILVCRLSNLCFIKNYFILIALFSKTFVFAIILFLFFILSGGAEGLNVYEVFNGLFGVGTIWGLLMQEYLTKKQKKWVFIATFIAILLALILGRRSVLLTYVVTILFYILYKFKYKLKSIRQRTLYLISSVIALIIIYLFFEVYGSVLFNVFFERMLDDTRSVVELNFLEDIYPGSFDFFWGRGISGSYYCPFVETNGADYREHIESGYLELILKGGVVLIVLYFFFTLPAIFLGLFKSNNNFCKLASVYCILFSGFLYGVGSYYTFGVRYVLLLFCVFICYKKKFRLLKDKDVVKFINN